MLKNYNNDKKTVNEKRGQFMQYIEEIANLPSLSNEEVGKYLKLFEKLYENGFRHFYSDILIVLLKLDKHASDKNTIVLERLPANLEILHEEAAIQSKKCSEKLMKLYDHCLMDCSRISYWKEQDITYHNFCSNTQVEITEYSKLLEDLKNNFKNDIQEMKKESDTFKAEKNEINSKIERANEEAITVKKDLISIMGIFMGVFSFIQWNFSQYRDLLEYDPFNRVLYILAIDSVLILSLYCVFAMIDFIVHKEPRMAKPFLNLNTKKPTIFGIVFALLYLLFLFLCVWGLNSDSARKTISKIETEIENIQIENRERTDTKIESLKLEMEKINQEHEAKIEEVSKKIKELEQKETKK
ncbi:MAG: hypothetical protein MSH33_05520 [Fusobacterium necrophorum]|nr:hypothetical protein [Fusobacterium necrophorum]